MSSPPPRPPLPPPSGKARRRPTPPLPGSWIWFVVIALILGFWLLSVQLKSGTVTYDDLVQLVEKPELSKHLTKFVFVGTSHVYGEVDKPDELPAKIKDKLAGNSFHGQTLPGENVKLKDKVYELAKDNDSLTVESHEDYFSGFFWVL